ncbi:MerR family transcriptional regulator [Patescibacteria group bacterium]|nr:MerR family transcriptional regulator [Patescibacteria group bacterium]MBU1970702.1 MerR family transcriptional regulator [Patescibacteria group bacterium]
MDNYISLEKLITEAGKKGVDFGKGDPYNRLRYYTKIGLLPHMVRKSVNGELVGHYPAYALDTLLEIEKLKSLGFKNEEIARKLKELSVGSSRSSGHTVRLARLLTPSAKTVKTALFVLFCLVILAGFGLLPVGKSKSDLIQKTLELDKRYISDSGNALMPRNQKKVYIKASSVKSDSRINITFTSDYSPATRYWVAQKTPFEGFYLELDAPTAMDADFSWWISN